jgi:peptide-methionine (R)-S-oxide reductase
MSPSRRNLLQGVAALVSFGAPSLALANEARYAASPFRKLSEADWRKRLPPASFDVLRHAGTEHPFTSPFAHPGRKGVFACLGCELPLFQSAWQFDSGTGWPSFWTVMKENIGTKRDFELIEERTEYHCARCLGHQGHVFNDGPRPTGLRYCNNGVALKVIPG